MTIENASLDATEKRVLDSIMKDPEAVARVKLARLDAIRGETGRKRAFQVDPVDRRKSL